MKGRHGCNLGAVPGDSRVLIRLFIGSQAMADGQPEQAHAGHGWALRIAPTIEIVITPAAISILTREEAARNHGQGPFHRYAMAPGSPESQGGKLAVRVIGRPAN